MVIITVTKFLYYCYEKGDDGYHGYNNEIQYSLVRHSVTLLKRHSGVLHHQTHQYCIFAVTHLLTVIRCMLKCAMFLFIIFI